MRALFEPPEPRSRPDAQPLQPDVPYLEWFFGRDQLADDLVSRVDRDQAEPVAILGPGGMGKSTLAVAVLHRDVVVDRYGVRRYFVRLDGAPSAAAVLERLGAALGLAGAVTMADVRASLARAPALLVLDNLETPWEQDKRDTEQLLVQVANVRGVALIVTMRGATKPAGLAWGKPVRLKRLSDDVAQALFCAIADVEDPNDPVVNELVSALDGIPLAVKLLAHRAEGDLLVNLRTEWTQKRLALLSRPGMTPDRLSSWEISVELSWASPRMTEAARRLASLLALLPDGLAVEDANALVPEHGGAAVRELGQVSLAYAEEPRLRMLAPIREHLAAMHPPKRDDLVRTMEHYRQLAAELGPRAGHESGASAVARLAPETANMDDMIRRGLDETDPRPWIDAAAALRDFASISGYTSPSPLVPAIEATQTIGDRQRQAICIFSLGDIVLRRSEHEHARACYEQAQPLFEQVDDLLGQANCILRLGDIALRRTEHEHARAYYEQAHPLFEQVGSVLGQANCIMSLGDIALRRSEHERARACFEQAQPLFEQVGSVLGQANCIMSLGDIALARSEREQARTRYEQALDLYSRIPEPYSMGRTERRLARMSEDDGERAQRVATACRLWASIDRPDLVAELDEEFGTGG
ncbi:tetratricopeptide repeat protein [Haliangium sp.]|uniref:tetratricopeptide repeat protein n=1 Tax=Haliangium sp. TaxID=2663208 RepID=UPI003D100F7A